MKIGICSPVNPCELKEYLHSDKEIPSINKGATAINTYIKELLVEGHEVTVFTSAVPSNEPNDIVLKGDKLEIHIIHSTPGIYIYHALSRIYMIKRLRKYMHPYIGKIDVLHAQWTYDFALAAKAYEKEIPVFCTVRDWCPYIMSIQKGFRKLQWWLYNLIFKEVMNSKHICFIANSEYTYKQIVTKYPSKHVNVIYNPIDKSLILNNKCKSVSGIVFISIARNLAEGRKNVRKLLEAFQFFRKKHLYSRLKLIGCGLEVGTPIYKEYKKAGLLESVDLLGQLRHIDLIDAIDDSTCLIHPSLEETFGNILVEAMARCVPIIGGEKSGAVPQVLEEGACGILCNVSDVNSIIMAMEKACDKKFSDELVKRATIILKEKYSSDSIVHQHIYLYKSHVE